MEKPNFPKAEILTKEKDTSGLLQVGMLKCPFCGNDIPYMYSFRKLGGSKFDFGMRRSECNGQLYQIRP